MTGTLGDNALVVNDGRSKSTVERLYHWSEEFPPSAESGRPRESRQFLQSFQSSGSDAFHPCGCGSLEPLIR